MYLAYQASDGRKQTVREHALGTAELAFYQEQVKNG